MSLVSQCPPAFLDNDFTLSVWSKAFSSSRCWIFSWTDLGWGGTFLHQPSQQQIDYRYATGDSSTNKNVFLNKIYADNVWHHYSFRKFGQTISLRVDGKQVDSYNTSRIHSKDSVPLYIGTNYNGNEAYGNRSTCLFCMFSRALSDEESDKVACCSFINVKNSLFNDLVFGYQLDDSFKLSDATGNYPLSLYNSYSATVSYSEELFPAQQFKINQSN